MTRRTKTVSLEKGGKTIEYAKCTERLAEFHRDNKNGRIETTVNLGDGFCTMRAVVTPDVDRPARWFSGHSLGKIAAEKALEKLETLAVGRALAMAGYLATGEIASAEEMERFHEATITVIDPKERTDAMEKLQTAKDLAELRKIWAGLSQVVREDGEVISLKNSIKAKYENPQGTGAENTGVGATA